MNTTSPNFASLTPKCNNEFSSLVLARISQRILVPHHQHMEPDTCLRYKLAKHFGRFVSRWNSVLVSIGVPEWCEHGSVYQFQTSFMLKCTVPCILFRPTLGVRLFGRITSYGHKIVRVIVHEFFPGTIKRSNIVRLIVSLVALSVESMKVDDYEYIIFAVTNVENCQGQLRLHGEICEACAHHSKELCSRSDVCSISPYVANLADLDGLRQRMKRRKHIRREAVVKTSMSSVSSTLDSSNTRQNESTLNPVRNKRIRFDDDGNPLTNTNNSTSMQSLSGATAAASVPVSNVPSGSDTNNNIEVTSADIAEVGQGESHRKEKAHKRKRRRDEMSTDTPELSFNSIAADTSLPAGAITLSCGTEATPVKKKRKRRGGSDPSLIEQQTPNGLDISDQRDHAVDHQSSPKHKKGKVPTQEQSVKLEVFNAADDRITMTPTPGQKHKKHRRHKNDSTPSSAQATAIKAELVTPKRI